jgi:hypothetical protein
MLAGGKSTILEKSQSLVKYELPYTIEARRERLLSLRRRD